MSGGFCKAAKKQRPLWFFGRGLGETILWPPKNGFPQNTSPVYPVRRESTWLFIRISIKRK
jgi:hypothetical protein